MINLEKFTAENPQYRTVAKLVAHECEHFTGPDGTILTVDRDELLEACRDPAAIQRGLDRRQEQADAKLAAIVRTLPAHLRAQFATA